MRNYLKPVVGSVIIAVILVILFVTYFSFKENSLVEEICLGIIISIISSLLFFIFSNFLFVDNTDIKDIKSKLQEVNDSCKLSDDLDELGICNIKSIAVDDKSPSFWLDILNNSHQHLDIIAHTLSPWFKDDYEEAFVNKIIELANNNHIVRILILDPQGHNLNFINTGNLEEYREKILNTVDSIKNMYGKIEADHRKNLVVKFNHSYVIPYSYIRNDDNTYVAPYLCSNAERSSFITVCKYGGKFANVFNNDFEDVFKNSQMRVMDDIILVRKEHSASNEYSSRNWNAEDTYRYVFKVGELLVEAGYYIHYKDGKIVDKTIELSTSCGCICKCKYCASSQIPSFTQLSANQIMSIYKMICQLNDIKSDENNLIIAMTGSGDYRYTYESTNEFMLSIHRRNIKAEFIISSCAWTDNLVKEAEKVADEGVAFKYLQCTYISHDKNKVKSVIQHYPHECDMNKLNDVIINSKLSNKFRINYLMIKDINDDLSFNNFVEIVKPIKDDILVRISKLNKTSSSVKNNLNPTGEKELLCLKEICEQNNIEAYIFRSQQNDNMNCGQLIMDILT